jgi:hypothetical protein
MLRESRKQPTQAKQTEVVPSTFSHTQASTPALVNPKSHSAEENNPNFDTNAYSSMLDVNAFET